MNNQQALHCEKSQPEIGTQIRVPAILRIALCGLEAGLLDDVGGIDPTGQPMVHAQRDLAPQSLSVNGEPLLQPGRVGGPKTTVGSIVGCCGHTPTIITAQLPRFDTAGIPRIAGVPPPQKLRWADRWSPSLLGGGAAGGLAILRESES
jgi:hypothetical protein